MTTHRLTAKHFTFAFIAVMALGALSFGLSFLPLGEAEVPVAMGIAGLKAAIVAFYFMHLVEQPSSHRFIAVIGVVFVLVLILFSSADVLTRAPVLDVPAGAAHGLRTDR